MDIPDLEPEEPPEPSNGTRNLNRGNQPGRRSPYSQAVDLQDQILRASKEEKCTKTELSNLARAWDVLEERKRILRGIPLPGSLRPDLDPAQALKMMKRLRSRQPIEIQGREQ